MRKLFLGVTLVASILIACGDESSSSGSTDENVPESSSNVSGSSAKSETNAAKNKTEISYGTMTDSRDGKEYKTITAKMFDGKDTLISDTWMQEDLAYEKRAIYRDEENGPDTLYSYEVEDGVLMYYGDAITAGKCVGFFEGSAMNCDLHLPFQGICPDGWHLPDTVEANRWRTFLKNGDGVGEAFYRPSSSEECDDVDYLFAVTDTNFHFWGLEARPECADKVHDYDLRDASVRCVKGDAYVEPVVVYPAYDGDFETFEDSRDGKSYKTVVIGKQTWMAENLDYEAEESDILYGTEFPDALAHGRAYSWSAAKEACPTGWRLPSKADFKTLKDYITGEWPDYGALALLGKQYGWEMDTFDAYGFNALYDDLPGGAGFKGGAFYWTSTEDEEKAVMFVLHYDEDGSNVSYPKEKFAAVRCLKE